MLSSIFNGIYNTICFTLGCYFAFIPNTILVGAICGYLLRYKLKRREKFTIVNGTYIANSHSKVSNVGVIPATACGIIYGITYPYDIICIWNSISLNTFKNLFMVIFTDEIIELPYGNENAITFICNSEDVEPIMKKYRKE